MPPQLRSLRLPLLALLALFTTQSPAQDRLKTMPGYERHQRITQASSNAFRSGALSVVWTNDSRAFDYGRDGKRFRFDLESQTTIELGAAPTNSPGRSRRRGNQPPAPVRGRQYTAAISPDGQFTAQYRDRNVWLTTTNDTNGFAVTTQGDATTRVKFGSANWVYGEELFQNTAMWWSTNSRKLAFYRFDESQVPDFYLQLNQTKIVSNADIEPYTKAGATNPVVDIFIYDLDTKQTIQVDARDGGPFDNSTIGHYLYGVSWTRDSRELLFHRTNRRQNVMELCAADAATGKVRVVIREEWLPSWTENSPTLRFLTNSSRFIWESERNGWKNFYLYDLNGTLLNPITQHSGFEVADIVRIDEMQGLLYYTARDGDNPMKPQLHRVGLDGRGDQRLTDPGFHHTISFAPDGRHFLDTAQTHSTPPVTVLRNIEGEKLVEVARSDVTKFQKIGLKKIERFTFKAADGKTDLYGMLHFPSNFRSYKKYPLLVSVYAGPATVGARETFGLPNSITEYGFLVASFDSRSASGRGKEFLDAIYLKLGQPEIDDQAAGVKFLSRRRYVDRKRVGIYGTSYGGTAAIACLLRYPDLFHAACSSAPVTDFRNYDTIYTERYMGLPQENKEGYDAAASMTYVNNLRGRLLLYYGTADDNVHPNNAMQLIRALQRAGKSFELQAGPDLGHGTVNRERMMEFFIENLILK